MPGLIKEFIKEFPNIDISLKVGNTEDIIKMISNNDIDFAFIEADVDLNKIEIYEFWTDELIVVAFPGHKWGGCSRNSKGSPGI